MSERYPTKRFDELLEAAFILFRGFPRRPRARAILHNAQCLHGHVQLTVQVASEMETPGDRKLVMAIFSVLSALASRLQTPWSEEQVALMKGQADVKPEDLFRVINEAGGDDRFVILLSLCLLIAWSKHEDAEKLRQGIIEYNWLWATAQGSVFDDDAVINEPLERLIREAFPGEEAAHWIEQLHHSTGDILELKVELMVAFRQGVFGEQKLFALMENIHLQALSLARQIGARASLTGKASRQALKKIIELSQNDCKETMEVLAKVFTKYGWE